MTRPLYLTSLLGRPWAPQGEGPAAYSCWGLACEVETRLFGRHLPAVSVPADLTWRWAIDTLAGHPEREAWREIVSPQPGLITAADGALVLMARADRPAHIGVWLAPERAVIHADHILGVVAESVPTLRARAWTRLRFYEPK